MVRPALSDYRRLWLGYSVSTTGDGVTLAAGPLLVASLTHDPLLVAGALFAQRLPWLLFSLVSGVCVDRLDRRRLMAFVDLGRAVIVGGLALSIALGGATIDALYVTLFLLGTGETLARTATLALLPSVVGTDGLGRANAQMQGSQVIGSDLAAPPFGAFLFVLAAALPFAFDSVTFVVAGLLGLSLRTPRRPQRTAADPASVARRHRGGPAVPVAAAGAAQPRPVHLPDERHLRGGLGPLRPVRARPAGARSGGLRPAAGDRRRRQPARRGHGQPAHRATRHVHLLRAGMAIEACTHLVLALTRTPWVAGLTLAVFGVHAAVWSIVTVTLRQRLVPDDLLGRVTSAYALFSAGGAAVGALLGGILAHDFGLTAPFWFGFAVVGTLALASIPDLRRAGAAGGRPAHQLAQLSLQSHLPRRSHPPSVRSMSTPPGPVTRAPLAARRPGCPARRGAARRRPRRDSRRGHGADPGAQRRHALPARGQPPHDGERAAAAQPPA